MSQKVSDPDRKDRRGWGGLAQNATSQRLPRTREVWNLSLCDSGGSQPCVPVFTSGDDASGKLA